MSMDKIARDIREGVFPKMSEVKVNGVGRMADNPKALLVILSAEPTDDELRSFNDFVIGWHPPGSEQNCSGHIASVDNRKICARCGIHIDSLRPDDEQQ